MTLGPGKYDAATTMLRATTGARGVVVIVVGGTFGDGFSVQAPIELLAGVPELLRDLARRIEADMRSATRK